VFIAGIVVIVIAVIGLGVYAFISSRAQSSIVQERLGRYADVVVQATPVAQPTSNKPKQSALGERLNEALRGRSFFGSMQIWLSAADLKMNVGEFFALSLMTAIGGVLLALAGTVIPDCSASPLGFLSCVATRAYTDSLVGSIIGAVVGGIAPRFYVNFRKDGRFTAFNDQLGDTLNLLVNALRSGYSVLQAMEAVSKELPPPISVEFRRVVQEIQLGLPMEVALEHLLERIASEDLDLVITAMNIQREVGGNLAEILDTMSHTIRERVRIKGEIATLTSQGMATGYAITGMPFALMLLLAVVNRPYIAQFFDAKNQPCGWAMLIAALIMISIGGFVIKKIVTIEI
jgi:tight adherence protein B